MSGAPTPTSARLLALRLHGFKSFAERTVVEFGGGISAIVGPNGSGKSNLADALRWALGEQGRALRSRKAEDVIWAGSEKRAAQGMADVTLLLDNADGLLPVDYQVLELGRRLYRSGENDYLLNKQRVRLRDLVDLLDGAHLADNAFLFIGQGMVDQALALRPEERRPLFEEVAGVRRHERRRRKAETQLAESEANLARVEDIVAELRPQVRRLAAQAEQQATRASAGDDLAGALLLAGHARWFEASARVAAATDRRTAAQSDADRAMAELRAAEDGASVLAAELSARVAVERERREVHEAAQAAVTALRLRDGRLASDLEAIGRDRARLGDERAAAEADIATQRRSLARPAPSRDVDLESALAEAEHQLADALGELATLRAARQARGDELAAVRRAEAARQAELETARRRLVEAERRVADEARIVTAATSEREAVEAAAATAGSTLRAALEVEREASAAVQAVRAAAESLAGAGQAAAERSAAAGSALAELRGRLGTLEARLAEDEARGIARAARRLGGRRLDEDLVVDPDLRPAVEVALAEAARAYLVDPGAIGDLATERGMLVVPPPDRPGAAGSERGTAARASTVRDRAAELGGGPLEDALRRDGLGAARRLLARALWLPDLDSCLALRVDLPPGWIAVPRDGSAVVTDQTVTLGRADAPLERREEAARLAAEVERLETERSGLSAAADAAAAAAVRARDAVEEARAAEARATAERRRAEDQERVEARRLEAFVREAGWHEAQAARLDAELARARQAVLTLESDAAARADAGASSTSGGAEGVDGAALATWEARVDELRARRDRLAGQVATHDAARREVEALHARAEAAIAMGEERLARADRDGIQLAERERGLHAEHETVRADLAAATARETAARASLDELRAADAADRDRLTAAETAAGSARERLRVADERLRAADHADLEARLGLDALREGLLVELAGLGPLGLARLRQLVGDPQAGSDGAADPRDDGDTGDAAAWDDQAPEDTSDLAAALDAIVHAWSATRPDGDPPSPGRLATLRRRYHELGAVNPYAVEEHAEVRARLDLLEGQAADLHTAIARTRELIDELNAMIADQFRRTFAALETAFESRFRQLFGGGEAQLSLTDPSDLAATGVEIVARPPGKKPQALAMLSGGERALTAVALLFAMLEVRPVPFCVLDEVDAALDEANIGRFADAVRGLADRTQFIVITHNRGTIEAADALYGVTVGDDSVSRVISLRLDEAQALAERRGELAPAG